VVPRVRLAPLQAVAQRSRLVLVAAPAGYGKSTLVAPWCDLDPRASCWVQLGHGDSDPVVLLARLTAALERMAPVDGELIEELSRPTPRIEEVALPLLGRDLAKRTRSWGAAYQPFWPMTCRPPRP
jgi:ATP/maltotriose-dependent transcriptional regulator MalT